MKMNEHVYYFINRDYDMGFWCLYGNVCDGYDVCMQNENKLLPKNVIAFSLKAFQCAHKHYL